MLLLLAALPSPDSPQAVGWILLSGAALAIGVNQILSFVDRFREQPPPNQTYTTKAEQRDFAKKVDEEQKALLKKMDEELGRERGSRKKIHEEVAAVQSEVKVLQKVNDLQSQQLTNLDAKMDQVLLRLPRGTAN